MTEKHREKVGPRVFRNEIDEALRDVSGAGLFGQVPLPDVVVHGVEKTDDGTKEIVSIASEGDIRLPAILKRPHRWVNAVVVLTEGTFAQDIARDLVAEGVMVLEIDLRHVPEDGVWSRFYQRKGRSQYAFASAIAGIPLVSQWANDIQAAVMYLSQQTGSDGSVGLYAEGPETTIAALLAAHRSDRIGWLAVNGVPATLVPAAREDTLLLRDLAFFAPTLLRYGDVSDLIATLAPQRILIVAPRGGGNAAENARLISRLLWEKRHVIIGEYPDKTTIVRFLKTRGTTPPP